MGINRLSPPFMDDAMGRDRDEDAVPVGLSPAVYAVIGTLFLIVVAMGAFLLLWKRSKLNW